MTQEQLVCKPPRFCHESPALFNYRLEVIDPAAFTKPVVRQKYCEAVSGVSVEPYRCTN